MTRWKKACATLSAALLVTLFSGYATATGVSDLIEASFKNAIVFVDVSSSNPVFREGKNICKSEGTGFFVGSKHVITAEHVYQLDPECGEKTIVLKSFKHKLQFIASVVSAENDVAVLSIDDPAPEGMCALRLMPEDVFISDAVRYGILSDLIEVTAVPAKIGQKDGGYKPLVLLSPTAAYRGESGGPVVYLFYVVGITRARHQTYPTFSFMTVGSKVKSLLEKLKIPADGRTCNPTEWYMTQIGANNFSANISLNWIIDKDVRSTLTDKVLADFKSVSVDIEKNPDLAGVNPSISAESDGSLTISSNARPEGDQPGTTNGTRRICRDVAPGQSVCELSPGVTASALATKSKQINKETIEDAAALTTKKLEVELWKKYIEEKNAPSSK